MSPKKGGNVYFQAKNSHHPCNLKKMRTILGLKNKIRTIRTLWSSCM